MFRYFTIGRIKRYIFLMLARMQMVPGQKRWRLLKWGGVNFLHEHPKLWIYDNVLVDTVRPDLIYIGNNVTITHGCCILTHFFDTTKPGKNFTYGKVVINDGAFIGLNALICNSVTIGENAVIGAGSVVTKDVPANEVWAGVPAKFIKKRPLP